MTDPVSGLQRFCALVQYDGTDYAGWQRQVNALSIQQVIEEALEKLMGDPVRITASGRTDTGVHALGQVFHFDARPGIRYEAALNTLLPKDIRILEVRRAAPDFHARFSARKKRYDYWMTSRQPDPFTWRYKWFRPKKPDPGRMREAAAFLLGTHDFTSFTNCHHHPDKSLVRTVTRLEILEEGEDIHLVFEGTGFLRYQVRMMTAVLDAAGRGRIEPQDVRRMLEMKDKHASRYNAPAHGLFLTRVWYDPGAADWTKTAAKGRMKDDYEHTEP